MEMNLRYLITVTCSILSKVFNYGFYTPTIKIKIIKIMLEFKNNYTIYETEITCVIEADEFNYSQNPTTTTGSFGDVKDFIKENYFSPYITTIGLYNDSNELLAVAKLGQPVKKDIISDMYIKIKIDF